ncbi:N-acetyltransferase [Thiorhodococcus mannitoliphagus]|uniref:N-acetyltransferase n=1 Tax=Thiorhodococcus mannitoliphagus TaxID=329406 RepID=A0A6P1DXW4_9GAMM|nr:N-acetyltransferase [Thiorhodococcus mannitoliphagus]NEX22539.1 N-acetyltransferase [Thiorhodococcus mannitoliphagus]
MSLSDTFRDLGWGDGLLYLLSEGLRRISKDGIRLIKYYLVAQPVKPSLEVPAHRGRDIKVREILAGDPLLGLIAHPPSVIESRFAQQAHCLLATRHQALAGYLWYVIGNYREDEVRCWFIPQPEDRAVWDFDVYVAPELRLSATFTRLWDAAYQQLYAQGYRFSCSRISAFKSTSLAAHRRLGARIVGRGLFLCIGSWQLTLAAPDTRWSLSIREQSVPRIPVFAEPAPRGSNDPQSRNGRAR